MWTHIHGSVLFYIGDDRDLADATFFMLRRDPPRYRSIREWAESNLARVELVPGDI